ncbi:hypothetical protein COU57_00375 [Candidatus Pacearchaeota archaeon CG10_big_fil_rev_8_21_14_0_10_32_14]|nr:MAG: hypothetical protein COU57_00375 [Candidatus Pacearchaeota archaeon CG10_big_fil_rev_8_21_14_0_10_32_14]
MRHIVYFSGKAQTSGNFDTTRLMEAGRMDIAIHSIIQGLFLSHDVRKDVVFHLVFYGMPDPPKHIEISIKDGLEISKKNVATLIKKILYKYKAGMKNEVFPGCTVEKKSLLKVVEELEKTAGENIFILNEKGEDIREVEIELNDKTPDVVFILGDHDGFPGKELKRLLKEQNPVTVGPKTYFASQVVAVVQNELDRRGI